MGFNLETTPPTFPAWISKPKSLRLHCHCWRVWGNNKRWAVENKVTIRLAQPSDDSQVQSLDERVVPYRPEDQPEVEAMYARARLAEKTNERWVPIPGPKLIADASETSYLAFWVAVLAARNQTERIVGMVGVGRLNFDMLPSSMPFTQAIWGQVGVLELQHLRVDPDFRGYGIGQQLCQTVINWSKEHGCPLLLVNTTSPQRPARRLYQKLGFQEVAVSYVGLYEMVWMELPPIDR
jgi:ribosomal protein S18 acetylase RimI-like enzyme